MSLNTKVLTLLTVLSLLGIFSKKMSCFVLTLIVILTTNKLVWIKEIPQILMLCFLLKAGLMNIKMIKLKKFTPNINKI